MFKFEHYNIYKWKFFYINLVIIYVNRIMWFIMDNIMIYLR